MVHDAEYFRARRRAKGIPERGQFDTRVIRQNASELRQVEQLPPLEWPERLFRDIEGLDKFMAVNGHDFSKMQRDDLCANPNCAKLNKLSAARRHNYAVSRVVEEVGFGFRTRKVIHYCTMGCRNDHMGFGRRSS